MDSPKKKRHSHAELIEIFSQKKIPDEFHSRFINEYDRIFNELYEDAKEVVLTEKKTSISYIQRRLRIGYNRAATIVEQLEQTGILSEVNAKGNREILS